MSPCLVSDCNWHEGEVTEREWQDYLKGGFTATTNSVHVSTARSTFVTQPLFASNFQLHEMQQSNMAATTTVFSAQQTHVTSDTSRNLGGMLTDHEPRCNPPVETPSMPSIVIPENAPMDLKPLYSMLAQISAQISSGNRKTEQLTEEVRGFNGKTTSLEWDVDEQ